VPSVQAAQSAIAPTAQAAQTQAAATVIAAHTAVAPTVVVLQASATAYAPTAQAVATAVAPTVQAAATITTSSLGTQVAESPLKITGVTVDSNDTTVKVQNSGSSSMSLNNYVLVMGPAFAVQLGSIDIPAGQTITLHFSPGITTTTDAYLGFGSDVSANTLKTGNRVVLVTPRSEIASVYSIP
jgi:hypothetical protein